MRTLKGVVVAAAVLAAWATPAKADWLNGAACGGTSFATCASVALVTGSNGTGTTIQITVTNLGANGMAGYYNSIFTSVGLVNLPSGVAPSSILTGSGGNGGNWASWDGPPPKDLNGLPADTYGMRAPSSVITNGLQLTQTISFTFQFTGTIGAEDLANIGIGIHGQSGPNGCSTKMAIINGQVTTTGPYDPECSSNIVPEPITMVLLGTGLAGVAGVARRRRNGLEIEDESEV